MLNQPIPDTVFVIIPFFNENTVIKQVVEDLLPLNYQLVIVDDDSDVSPAKNIQHKNLHFLRHKVNLGQGAAIQTGIEFALNKQAEWIITFDADGQHQASDLQNLLRPLHNDEADITIASRFLEKSKHNASAGRKLVLKTGRLVNYLFTGLYLSDAHNGLRAMNRKAAQKIQLKENRMAHATEFLLTIKKYKLKYKEVAATIKYTDYSKSKGQSSLNSIRIFFDLVLHKLFE